MFKDEEKSVFLIDVPRSLEEAQVLPGQHVQRRFLSVKSVSTPFRTPEPKDAGARQHAQAPAARLTELMTDATARRALEVLQKSHDGPFCLPRITRDPSAQSIPAKDAPPSVAAEPFIPATASWINGSVESKRAEFISTAPLFDLIVLDPPWPNRSAKRKRGGYATASGLAETRQMLSEIPIAPHLAAEGLVAIWVTNKPSLADLLIAPGHGMLDEWGLEVAAEWTWLKVTSTGEPLYDLDSTWRKPWERLIVARKRGSQVKVPRNRVMVAVPDAHSRKPHLRQLFADLIPPAESRGLEIFARNLTAGWWSWGDEVLRFQHPEYWLARETMRNSETAHATCGGSKN